MVGSTFLDTVSRQFNFRIFFTLDGKKSCLHENRIRRAFKYYRMSPRAIQYTGIGIRFRNVGEKSVAKEIFR